MPIDQRLLERIQNNDPELKELDFSNPSTDSALKLINDDLITLGEALTSNTNLESLTVAYHADVTDDGIKGLARGLIGGNLKLKKLKSLLLVVLSFTDEGAQVLVEAINKLPKIETVGFTWTGFGNGAAIKLSENRTLKHVGVARTQISDKGGYAILSLVENSPACISIDISGNPGLEPHSLHWQTLMNNTIMKKTHATISELALEIRELREENQALKRKVQQLEEVVTERLCAKQDDTGQSATKIQAATRGFFVRERSENEISILNISRDIIEEAISPKLSLQDLVRLARTSKGINSLFKKPLIDAKLTRLLKHVAFGEQDQAEKILKLNPALLLEKGQVTDYSLRTFNDITAFQYALWALDWHMWTMLLKYLPLEEAKVQWQALEMHGTAHGKEVNWQRLLDATEIFRTATSDWSTIWCQQIGSAQFLLPAHVSSEYFHPTRSMYHATHPVPVFTTSTRGGEAGVFYDEGLGKVHAWYRGEWPQAGRTTDFYIPDQQKSEPSIYYDAIALTALYATRRQQKEELIEMLSARLVKKAVTSSSFIHQP